MSLNYVSIELSPSLQARLGEGIAQWSENIYHHEKQQNNVEKFCEFGRSYSKQIEARKKYGGKNEKLQCEF